MTESKVGGMEGAEDVGYQGQLPYKSLWGEEAGGIQSRGPPERRVARKRRLGFTAGEHLRAGESGPTVVHPPTPWIYVAA